MPSSEMNNKSYVKDFLVARPEIKTIVDLGPGAATYAKYVSTDTINPKSYIWKAVEIWGPYIKRFDLERYYDEIRIGDIRYMEFPEGDCCIAGDILEHLRREDFIKVFKKIDKLFKYVIITIPVNLLSSDAFEGNEAEIHQSYWSIEELDKIFVGYDKKVIDPCVIYLKEPK